MSRLIIFIFFILIPIQKIKADNLTIIAVGDIMLGRYIGKDMAKKNKGFLHPYKLIKATISKANIAFGNLESPISARGKSTGKKYSFRASTESIAGLVDAGFDVLSLANNHSMDFGPQALHDTISLLKKNSISVVGAGKNLAEARKPAIFISSSTTVAFLAYDCTFRWTFASNKKTGTCPARIKLIREDIKKVREKCDIIIVSFHWGNEYSEKVSDFQKKMGHATIDAGADAVVGHHPHVLQGIEFYKNKPIVYSLGNFIFDQAFGKTRESLAVKFLIRNKKINRVVCIPIVRKFDTYYPRIANTKEKEKIKKRILNLSKLMNNKENLKQIFFE